MASGGLEPVIRNQDYSPHRMREGGLNGVAIERQDLNGHFGLNGPMSGPSTSHSDTDQQHMAAAPPPSAPKFRLVPGPKLGERVPATSSVSRPKTPPISPEPASNGPVNSLSSASVPPVMPPQQHNHLNVNGPHGHPSVANGSTVAMAPVVFANQQVLTRQPSVTLAPAAPSSLAGVSGQRLSHPRIALQQPQANIQYVVVNQAPSPNQSSMGLRQQSPAIRLSHPPSTSSPQQQHIQQQQQQQQHQQQHQSRPESVQQPRPMVQQTPQVQQQQPPLNATEQANMVQKCARFFKTLIHLSQQPDQHQGQTCARVKELVRAVIFGSMPPETFTTKLQDALRSQAQPHLLPFLRKTLPALRQALTNGELVIDGVSPPPPSVPQQTHMVQVQQPANQFVQQHMLVQQPSQQQQQQQPHRLLAPQQVVVSQPSQHYPHMVHQLQQPQPPMQPGMTMGPPSSNLSASSPAQSPMGSQSTASPSPNRPQSRPTAPLAPLSSPASVEPRPNTKVEPPDDDQSDLSSLGSAALSEDAQKALSGATEPQQADTRSLGDQAERTLLSSAALTRRIAAAMAGSGPGPDERVVALVSRAAEHRLRELLERLAVVAEHRLDTLRANPFYAPSSDTRRQLRYLEELDRLEQQRKEDREKEALIRLSRGKGKDKEKDTIREKAKELQRAEQEVMRNRDANAAAAAALGSTRATKRSWADANVTEASNPFDQSTAAGGLATQMHRPRTKRVNLRDLQLVLSQDKDLRQSFTRYRLAVARPPSDSSASSAL